jgi:translation elongation factor EF-Ts
MSESHCSFLQKNIFIAREIIQMKIVCNKENMYHRFMQKNKWVFTYFPNFTYTQTLHRKRNISIVWKLLSIVNLCMYGIQYVYMKNKITREKVSLHIAAFHPKDISSVILEMYNHRLKIYKNEAKSQKKPISAHHYITPGS